MLLISAGAAGGDYALAVVRQTLHMRAPSPPPSSAGATTRCGAASSSSSRRPGIGTGCSASPRRCRSCCTDADLFVGKPGGLSASECMAAGLPMVLVNPIPGQEVRNGDYLMEQGAAVRCNTTATIGWKIDEVLGEPGRLQRMQAAAAAGRPTRCGRGRAPPGAGRALPPADRDPGGPADDPGRERATARRERPDGPRLARPSGRGRPPGARSRCCAPSSSTICERGTPSPARSWCCGGPRHRCRSAGRCAGCCAACCAATTRSLVRVEALPRGRETPAPLRSPNVPRRDRRRHARRPSRPGCAARRAAPSRPAGATSAASRDRAAASVRRPARRPR